MPEGASAKPAWGRSAEIQNKTGETIVRVAVFERLMALQAGRRKFLQGAVALAGATALSGSFMGRAFAAEMSADEKALRQQILAIPGVNKGSPTDADWQKVGELCLGPTKANVAQGEFAGVELTFF